MHFPNRQGGDGQHMCVGGWVGFSRDLRVHDVQSVVTASTQRDVCWSGVEWSGVEWGVCVCWCVFLLVCVCVCVNRKENQKPF